MLSNIRTVALVALCMFAVLGLSMFITGRAWQTKQKRAREGGTRPSPAVSPSTEPSTTAGYVMPADSDLVPPSDMDMDVLRRAVFKAGNGDALVAAGDYRAAIAQYREALDIWPHMTAVWASLGRAYLEVNEYPLAQTALERAITHDPANVRMLNDLGVAHLYQNRMEKALHLFETATELDPQFGPSRYNLALSHLAQQDYEQAEDLLDQYLLDHPEEPKALKERAFLHARRGQYEEALENLRAAIEFAPDWAALYFDAAAAAALMGDPEDAHRYLARAETMTSPLHAQRVYQQEAFRELRKTEAGQRYKADLEKRSKEYQAASQKTDIPVSQPEPAFSGLPSP